jgi:hypothetical protein
MPKNSTITPCSAVVCFKKILCNFKTPYTYTISRPWRWAKRPLVGYVRSSRKGAQVAFFIVTDKKYGMTKEFFGTKQTKKKPNMPDQIELF